MDFTTADMQAIAPQLRKPEGAMGREVAQAMARNNDEVIAFTLECLGVEEADRLLEIGFGPGEGIAQAVRLAPRGFVCGIDHSAEMLTMAAERNYRVLMEESAELTFGSADHLPYDDEIFDGIFAVNVFHFWRDPAPELAECRRVLRSGGRVAFFMAYPSSWRPGLRESGVFIARDPEDVERALTDAGFVQPRSDTITLGAFRGFATTATRADR